MTATNYDEMELEEMTEEEKERVRELARQIRGKRTFLDMQKLPDNKGLGRETWRTNLEKLGEFKSDEQREKLAELAGWTTDELKEYIRTGLKPHEIPFEIKRERLMKKLLDFTPEERLAVAKDLLETISKI